MASTGMSIAKGGTHIGNWYGDVVLFGSTPYRLMMRKCTRVNVCVTIKVILAVNALTAVMHAWLEKEEEKKKQHTL